ncbi:hypothetical protein [Arthrobacter subterraneus]|uniref:hypothetical protein n=1 Tax=Arthrobacter subterraneus TaxID=335973 RepID=UPI0038023E0E
MAERGNTTHGPNLDDQLKHETQGLIQGNHPTRAEEWREAETVDDGEDSAPAADTDAERPVYERAPGEGADAHEGRPAEATEGTDRRNDEETQ